MLFVGLNFKGLDLRLPQLLLSGDGGQLCAWRSPGRGSFDPQDHTVGGGSHLPDAETEAERG